MPTQDPQKTNLFLAVFSDCYFYLQMYFIILAILFLILMPIAYFNINLMFRFWQGDPPIQDDPRLFDMNVKQRADQFVESMIQRSKSFKTNEIFIPWGCDFQYSNARLIFKVRKNFLRKKSRRKLITLNAWLLYEILLLVKEQKQDC